MSRTETVRLHAGDTLALIRDALRGLRSIYVPGHKYWKAGVMLNDVIEAKSAPAQMFPSRDPRQSARLMATMDAVNGRFGRGTISLPFQVSRDDGRRKLSTFPRVTRHEPMNWFLCCHEMI
jgi:DNA polymerase V